MTNFVFWNKNSGHSVETGQAGERGSQHIPLLGKTGAGEYLRGWVLDFGI